MTLQDTLETIRITAAEQSVNPSEITAKVIRLAAAEIADRDIAAKLAASADDMDAPVDLSDVATSLRQWGLQ